MSRENRDLRDYYKTNMVQAYTAILSGKDSAFVGVGSIGKSNFLRAIGDRQVMEMYLPRPNHYIVVYVDSHLLQHDSTFIGQSGAAYPGYELMFCSLLERIKEMQFDGQWLYPTDELVRQEMLKYLQSDYGDLRTNRKGDSYSGLRYLKDACDMFLGEHPDLHIVFLFDEIERLFRYLPVYFFEQLRGLRDKFKYQLILISTSRYLMSELSSGYDDPLDREEVEGFTDLFKGTEHAMLRLDEATARQNIERYRQRYNAPELAPELIELLLQASGGHAGLLRHSFQLALRYRVIPNVSAEEQVSAFCRHLLTDEEDEGVLDECKTIYRSLLPDEQEALHEGAHDPAAAKRVVKSLTKKQLFYREKGKIVAIPVFDTYVSMFQRTQRE